MNVYSYKIYSRKNVSKRSYTLFLKEVFLVMSSLVMVNQYVEES